MSKNAQGLPLNLIVLAVIAALVLVLIIAFTVGGAGSVFGRIGKTSSAAVGEDIDAVRSACREACSVTQNSLSNTGQWTTSNYCVKQLNVDLNGDGTLGAGETGLRCWTAPINIGCSVSVSAPTGVVTVSEAAGSVDAACK